MNAAEWMTCTDPKPMLELLRKRGYHERKLHLFGCACCRRIWSLMREEVSRYAVELAERFADSVVAWDDMKAASNAAWDAARLPSDCTPETRPPVGCWYAARAAVGGSGSEVTGGYLEEYFATPGVDIYVLTADLTALAAAAAVATATIRWDDPAWERRMHAAWIRSNEAIADRCEDVIWYAADEIAWDDLVDLPGWAPERAQQAALLRDLFGDPFAPPPRVVPSWLAWNDGLVRRLAASIYEERSFDRMPILADALEEAGCDNEELLKHWRGEGPHARGCFVLDLLRPDYR